MKEGKVETKTWKNIFRKENFLLFVLAGICLLIIAMPMGKGDKSTQSSLLENVFQDTKNDSVGLEQEEKEKASQTEEMENRLQKILAQMYGVGKVQVMITLECSEEIIIEKEIKREAKRTQESDSAGGSRIVTEEKEESESKDSPLISKTVYPKVQGVVVVAQGAGTGHVNNDIVEIVGALFGIEAHKVKVVKMKS